MIRQIQTFDANVLALEVIDGFTETDEKLCQKLFNEKRRQGFNQINVLVKMDEMKVSQSSVKAFFEDALWTLRNYKNLGHLAIVAHSNILKVTAPIDNLFFKRSSQGREERYFDVSKMELALDFVRSRVHRGELQII